MKWFRMLLAVVLLSSIGACSNVTAPKYPQDKEDPDEQKDPDSQGFHLAGEVTFWV